MVHFKTFGWSTQLLWVLFLMLERVLNFLSIFQKVRCHLLVRRVLINTALESNLYDISFLIKLLALREGRTDHTCSDTGKKVGTSGE